MNGVVHSSADNLDITPVIFVGGGATVMKLFGSHPGSNIQYIEDIRANARGYEYLGRTYLASNRRALEAEVGSRWRHTRKSCGNS